MLIVGCDNTTNNAPKNVVTQTTNSAPQQVVNNTTIINQGETRSDETTRSTSPSAAPSAPSTAPAATPAPAASNCGKLDIRDDGSWHFPRPDKTPRILQRGEYQLFQDGSAKITKAGEPDVGAVIKPPGCPTSNASPTPTTPVASPASSGTTTQPTNCRLDIKADGSWSIPRPPSGTPRTLQKGEYQLFQDGSAKITKAGEPDFGQIVKPHC